MSRIASALGRAAHASLDALISGIARLPWRALYALSDFAFVILYYLVRYRRKTVDKNLAESFPEMPEHERRTIRRKFYRNFTDYVVETIKVPRISDQEMRQRMEFVGVDLIDDILGSGQSIAAYFSHCFNWEWAPSVILWSSLANVNDPSRPAAPGQKSAAFCQVYRPLKDKWFDAKMLAIRDRFKPISIPKASTLRALLTLRRDGIPSITGFMADQKPSHGDPTYVTMWLSHPTAFITGTETLARRLGMAAIYWDMEKLGRGHYRITCRLIGRDLDAMPLHEPTAVYARMLADTIRRDPAIWLWTHKRWKIPVTLPN